MKIFGKLFIPALVIYIVVIIIFSGVVVEIENNSNVAIKDFSVNYGRGEYKLPSLLPGKKHKEKLGKIGEGANFEITWKYHENKSGKVTYNVYFIDMLPPTKIRLSISNPEMVSLEYQGKLFKPYVKKGT